MCLLGGNGSSCKSGFQYFHYRGAQGRVGRTDKPSCTSSLRYHHGASKELSSIYKSNSGSRTQGNAQHTKSHRQCRQLTPSASKTVRAQHPEDEPQGRRARHAQLSKQPRPHKAPGGILQRHTQRTNACSAAIARQRTTSGEKVTQNKKAIQGGDTAAAAARQRQHTSPQQAARAYWSTPSILSSTSM